MPHHLRLLFVVPLLAACVLGAAACSSSSDAASASSAKLRGRYALTADAGAPYRTIWFSTDRYEAVLATCDASRPTCLEEGTYAYDGRTLSLVDTSGASRTMGFVPSTRPTSTTLSHALGDTSGALAGGPSPEAPASDAGAGDGSCSSDAIASDDAAADDGAADDGVQLVSGPVVCLLDDAVVAAANLDFGGGDTGQATRLGDERPADPMSSGDKGLAKAGNKGSRTVTLLYLGSPDFLARCAGTTYGCGANVYSYPASDYYFSAPADTVACYATATFCKNGTCVSAKRVESSDSHQQFEGSAGLIRALGGNPQESGCSGSGSVSNVSVTW